MRLLALLLAIAVLFIVALPARGQNWSLDGPIPVRTMPQRPAQLPPTPPEPVTASPDPGSEDSGSSQVLLPELAAEPVSL